MLNSELKSTIAYVFKKEADAIVKFSDSQLDIVTAAIRMIEDRAGPVVVSGVGKSGHIARKIASTLRSLGKPASFLHAAEASHGDLGILQDNATIIVISNSGETTELSDLLHYAKLNSYPIISITKYAHSTLGRFSTVPIAYGEIDEACINGLAPTTSTTLALAIGDAIAVGLSKINSINANDFKRWHPGGKLGTNLAFVRDVMRSGADLPIVPKGSTMAEALVTMSEKSLGAVILLNDDNSVAGIITDGDMRRNITKLNLVCPLDIATKDPIYVSTDMLVTAAAALMSKSGITTCLVGSREGGVEGMIHIHDCVR